MTTGNILVLDQLTKTFTMNGTELRVLDSVSLEVPTGSSLAIVGPSGSGKSTLLSLAAGLDQPTSGSVRLGDVLLTTLSQDELATLRNRETGFVFQTFQLIPTLTALENVMVPLELRGDRSAERQALKLLSDVGLSERASHFPSELSGGEQQRVAIARAFINAPRILFADEPTGNLDEETGKRVIELLFQLNKDHGTTLLLVTHDRVLAERADRRVSIRGGRIQG